MLAVQTSDYRDCQTRLSLHVGHQSTGPRSSSTQTLMARRFVFMSVPHGSRSAADAKSSSMTSVVILRVMCHHYFMTPRGVRVMSPNANSSLSAAHKAATHSESDTRVQLKVKLVTAIKQFPRTVHKFFSLRLFYRLVFSTLITSLSKHPTAFKQALCSTFGDVAKSSCSAGESMCGSDMLE